MIEDNIVKALATVFVSDKSEEEMATELNAMEKGILLPYIDPSDKYESWKKVMLNENILNPLKQFGVQIGAYITGTLNKGESYNVYTLEIVNMDGKQIHFKKAGTAWEWDEEF